MILNYLQVDKQIDEADKSASVLANVEFIISDNM